MHSVEFSRCSGSPVARKLQNLEESAVFAAKPIRVGGQDHVSEKRHRLRVALPRKLVPDNRSTNSIENLVDREGEAAKLVLSHELRTGVNGNSRLSRRSRGCWKWPKWRRNRTGHGRGLKNKASISTASRIFGIHRQTKDRQKFIRINYRANCIGVF